jgi:hypothetical protein
MFKDARKSISIFGLITLAFIFNDCSIKRQTVSYPDSNFPSLNPKIFAPGKVSLPNRLEQNITFSKDGKEYYYGLTSSREWWYETIIRTRILENGKAVTDTLPFIKNLNHAGGKLFVGEPLLTLDGKKLFFLSDIPTNIWVAQRNTDGEWGVPMKLDEPVNSDAPEWYPSVSQNETLYFASKRSDDGKIAENHKIYKSQLINGKYQNVTLLKGNVNQEDASDPCIAPDETFMVLASKRKGGYGGTDLYISRKGKNDEWSTPINLGEKVNTEVEEVGPRISPDGKYLFFYRRDKWENATSSDIFWVDIAVLKNK